MPGAAAVDTQPVPEAPTRSRTRWVLAGQFSGPALDGITSQTDRKLRVYSIADAAA